MYGIAGELIEFVSGKHWIDFVDTNILMPLHMTLTQTRSTNIFEVGNYTTPHVNDLDDGLITVEYTFSDQIGATGMMWSSINDVSNYLTFLGNQGIFEIDTSLQPAAFKI
jgi:CubicO group peptidase (beta-lactamase class C family)